MDGGRRGSLDVRAKIGFVDLKLIDKPYYLPLAVSVGNGQDWATCVGFISPIIRLWGYDQRFERLEQTVWQAEPKVEKDRRFWKELVSLQTVMLPHSSH